MRAVLRAASVVGAIVVIAAGCGGSKSASTTGTITTSAATAVATTTADTVAASTPAPAPLQAEAKAAATGDVPDNQVFIRFTDTSAGYSMKYPEGWAQQGSGSNVTIRDNNNIVRVLVVPGGAVTPAHAKHDLASVPGATVTTPPRTTTIGGHAAVKVVYTTRSGPNPVTGKRLTLLVDRYYVWQGGKRAVVDLGTPVGVDNVDAYRLMIESFKWR